jgi:hypothetical protein
MSGGIVFGGGMERWMPIPGLCGLYEASSNGRIRSLPREVSLYNGGKFVYPGRALNPSVNRVGYECVCINGKKRMVHILVASAFLGERPNGLVIRHIDGDSLNNSADNIAYGTQRENSADRERHGRTVKGEAVKCSKLTTSDVLEIRRSRESDRSLAPKYGVSHSAINYARRQGWRHVA